MRRPIVHPTTQLAMFQTEDLPLFSGAPVQVQAQVFEPQPAKPPEPVLAACRFCLDTGVLGTHAYCWCEAGQRARQRRHGPDPEVEAMMDEQNALELAIAKAGGVIEEVDLTREDEWYVRLASPLDRRYWKPALSAAGFPYAVDEFDNALRIGRKDREALLA